MEMLLLSIATLALGPLLVMLRRPWPVFEPALDAFVAVSIGGLVVLDIIPESVRAIGGSALAAAILGALVPILVHRLWSDGHGWGEVALLVAALLGLAAHGLLDGIALRPPPGASLTALGVAVVVHQGPLGAGLWWLLVERLGRGLTVAVLGVLAAATIAGFFLQPTLAAHSSTAVLRFGQSLLAGSLLHVVVEHRPQIRKSLPHERVAMALGGVCGAVVMWLVWRLDA